LKCEAGGTDVDPHFWPALYPGIIAGGLLGLAAGGLVATVLGACGGLIGAAAAYVAFAWLGVENELASLAGLIGGAVAGAQLLIVIRKRIFKIAAD
jgi:hypothetical protein